MKPSAHIIVSVPLSLGIWLFLKSVPAAIVCFASGVLVDVDHVFDCLVNLGWKGFSFRNYYRECEHDAVREGRFNLKKLHLIFHGVELAGVFLLLSYFTGNIYVTVFTIGYCVHLALDVMRNGEFTQPLFYFISWRASRGFRSAKLMNEALALKNSHLGPPR